METMGAASSTPPSPMAPELSRRGAGESENVMLSVRCTL
jgi:hypothetical protein